jgi:hypothetical protein
MEKGRYSGLDPLLETYLSREAIVTSGIFSYWRIRAWQWFLKAVFFDCRFKRMLNNGFLLILTVQILDHLFVQRFEENVDPTAPRPDTVPQAAERAGRRPSSCTVNL